VRRHFVRLATTRLWFLIFALVANLLVAGALNTRNAHACLCAGTATPTEELKASDAVFSGEVVGLGVDDPNPQDNVPLGGVKFRVKESWKGISDRSAIIYGQGEGYFGEVKEGDTVVINTCDVTFEQGRSYLVYAYRRGENGNGPLGTDICTATKPLSGAEADLRALGPPTVQMPDTGGSLVSPPESATTVTAILALLALSGGVLVVRRLSRGRRA
jgi:hypothetical protein